MLQIERRKSCASYNTEYPVPQNGLNYFQLKLNDFQLISESAKLYVNTEKSGKKLRISLTLANITSLSPFCPINSSVLLNNLSFHPSPNIFLIYKKTNSSWNFFTCPELVEGLDSKFPALTYFSPHLDQ